MKSRPLRARLILVAFLVLLVFFGALVARRLMVSPPTEPYRTTAPEAPKQKREVILYFGAEDGAFLTPEAREIEDCLLEMECIEATVRALVDGPVGDLTPVIPSHAAVRNVSEQNGTATVDFSRELLTGHPGGSQSELLTVYGLANTLAVNFPHIRQVRILVEGQPQESIKGHVDLRAPVQADFSFSRPPAGAEPEGGERPAEPIEESR